MMRPFPIDNTIEDFRNTYGNRTLNGSDLALIRGIFREEFNYFGVELRKYITSEIKNVTNFTAVDKIDVDNYLNDDVDKIDVDEVGIDDKENVVENSTRKYVSEIDKTNRRIAPPVKYFNLHSVTKKLEYFPKIESIYGELIKDVDLLNCVGLHDQVIYLVKKLCVCYDDCGRKYLASDIGRFCNTTTSVISGHIRRIKHGDSEVKMMVGKTPLVNDEEQNTIVKIVTDNENKHPFNISTLLHVLNPVLNKQLSITQLRHIIKAIKGIKYVKVKAFEADRNNISKDDLIKYIIRAKAIIDGKDPELVLNVDETSICDKTDFGDEKAVVSEGNTNPTTPVNNEPRRFTHVGAVSGNGEALPSMIITSRVRYDNVVWKRMNFSDILMAHQKNAYMTQDLFLVWLERILLPYITAKRRLLKEKNSFRKKAVLILDNAKCHYSTEIINWCKVNNVELLWLTPHASHLLQPLDLGVFGNMKVCYIINFWV